MAFPAEVNNVTSSHGTEWQKKGGAISYELYRYFIGDHGPFYEKFYAGEQDTPAIERRIAEHVSKLRTLGLLGTPTEGQA